MEYLVSIGADIHHPNGPDDPENLVDFAVSLDESAANEGLRWLLERGVSPNQVADGKKRCLALNSAGRNGNLEAVKLLVEHGADVNAYFLGSNGLSLAIQRNHTEIVSYLRSVGAKTPAEQGWKSSSQ
ncbi:MAG: ankyrin repeat domain-containing protein [Planctomycetaceae bacterium]|nr:ankyrin repeat domain-containing protein [Planctomycetaceae bacterium]